MKLSVSKFEIKCNGEASGSFVSVFSNGEQYYVTDTDGCDLKWFDDKQSALDWAENTAENYFE